MPSRFLEPIARAFLTAEELGAHVASGTIVLTSGFWFNWLLTEFGDPRIFDLIPWRYVVDGFDLAVLAAVTIFSIMAIRDIGQRGH